MTYLGYQVADEEICNEEVSAWIEKQIDAGKSISVWGKTPIGSGVDYVTDPEYFPWQCPHGGEDDALHCFSEEEGGSSCSFTSINESYTLTAVDPPSDCWGNTATYNGGIELGEGCFELGYADDSYTQYDGVSKIFSEIELGEDPEPDAFLEWVDENYPEIISRIEESGTSNGCGWSWTYWTTNKLLDGDEWRAIALEYLED